MQINIKELEDIVNRVSVTIEELLDAVPRSAYDDHGSIAGAAKADLDTLLEAYVAQQWQDISTAPRDGSVFMHWEKEHNRRGLCWFCDGVFMWTGGIVASLKDGDMWCTSTVLPLPPAPVSEGS